MLSTAHMGKKMLLRRVRLSTRLLFLPLFLALAGCAGQQPLLEPMAGVTLQWPEQPYAAQIAWVKSVSVPEDAGIGKSFWKRALDFITGPDDNNIVRPYGVLYDEAGRLMVADRGAGVVHVMDTEKGRYLRIPEDKGALFSSPIGVAEDGSNRLYITDSERDAVFRYDFATGQLSLFLTDVERPTGIVYNRVNKLLYISETTARRVIAVDETGAVRFAFGDRPTPKQGALNLPTDLAVDGRGRIFVNDPLNYKIKIFSKDGAPLGEFGAMGDARGEMNKPKGIAVDAEGHVYVTDSLHDAVQIFDDKGQFLFSFGGTGTEDGAFWMPSGLAVHGSYIFVADTFNQRVQVFKRIFGDKDASKGTAGMVQVVRGRE